MHRLRAPAGRMGILVAAGVIVQSVDPEGPASNERPARTGREHASVLIEVR